VLAKTAPASTFALPFRVLKGSTRHGFHVPDRPSRSSPLRPMPSKASFLEMKAAGKDVIGLGRRRSRLPTSPRHAHQGAAIRPIPANVQRVQSKHPPALRAAPASVAKLKRDPWRWSTSRRRPSSPPRRKQIIFNSMLLHLNSRRRGIIPAPYWCPLPRRWCVRRLHAGHRAVPGSQKNASKLQPDDLERAITANTKC